MAEAIPLDELAALYIDFQTTGTVPGRADIIEIGWARSDACVSRADLNSYLIKQPENKKIPRRIKAVTGIRNEDLESGACLIDVWNMLVVAASDIAQADALQSCPAVIHYASFERPFLHYLHRLSGSLGPFPFTIICTHEISRRVFSWLPRASMRAIAGYFGHTLGERRRCADHLLATARIWQESLKILKQRHGVVTFGDLQQWLKRPFPYSDKQKIYPMGRGVRQALPDQPGVYRMLRSNGDLLYIGKASSLKKRANSYFGKRSRHPGHIMEMLSQAKKIDATVTGSALEAAIMEFDEIRLLAPPYNVAQRRNESMVWFLGSDFEKISNTTRSGCGIGPFSSDLPASRLRALKRLVYDGWYETDGRFLFGLGTDAVDAQDLECIKKGLASFVDAYREAFAAVPLRNAFEQLGKRFWSQRSGVAGKDGEEIEPSRVPASVKHMLESFLRRDVHEIRRARLAVWLSEAVLAWEERGRIAMVVIERGRLAHSSKIRVGNELPAPPGYRHYRERLDYIDGMILDRMKVLTAEIRRLVSRGKWIKLCMRPGVILDRKELRHIFQWV